MVAKFYMLYWFFLSTAAVPDTWPDDMTLTLAYYGGRNPQKNEVEIGKNGFQKLSKAGTENRKEISFSQTELDQLLYVLKKNRFSSIKSVRRKSIAYDKPTSQMTLKWGTETHTITSSASEELNAGDKESYLEIHNHIVALLEEKNVSWP